MSLSIAIVGATGNVGRKIIVDQVLLVWKDLFHISSKKWVKLKLEKS